MPDRQADSRSLNFAGDVDEQGRPAVTPPRLPDCVSPMTMRLVVGVEPALSLSMRWARPSTATAQSGHRPPECPRHG